SAELISCYAPQPRVSPDSNSSHENRQSHRFPFWPGSESLCRKAARRDKELASLRRNLAHLRARLSWLARERLWNASLWTGPEAPEPLHRCREQQLLFVADGGFVARGA